MDNIEFRAIGERDLQEVLNIYNHYILTSTANFFLEKISIEKLKTVIYVNHPRYRSFLILTGQEIAGFCFLTRHKGKEAYNRTADSGLYLKPEFTGKGIGGRVVDFLEAQAREVGLKVLVASISGENIPSMKLFEKKGYEKCGHFRKVGEKFGRILDVVYYQKILDTAGNKS